MSKGGIDRRPWLILSRREALALQQAALRPCPGERAPRTVSGALARALRVIDLQLMFIEGGLDGEQSTPNSAVERDMLIHD